MFKNVLKRAYSDISLEEIYTLYLLGKAQVEEEVCEITFLINRLLTNDKEVSDLYEQASDKGKKLANLVLENKKMMTLEASTEFFDWIRYFRNDSIKYVICARAISDLELYPEKIKKDDMFNLVAALNMDRKHKIFDYFCLAVEKKFGNIPLNYFLKDKDIEEIATLFDVQKGMKKLKDINKVHCGIIRVLEDLDEAYKDDFTLEIKILFEDFNNIKVSSEYDKNSVNLILTLFYLLEDYFMFKWEYIRERGLEGFVEKYICFDK